MPGLVPRSVLGATKRRIVGLLRRGATTVLDLARALRLTGNAVRAHLADLERDGLVVQVGVRPGRRKPAHVYALAPDAATLVSKAYVPLLSQLLHVLEGRLSRRASERVVRAAGAELAAGFPKPSGTVRQRTEGAVGILRQLGAQAVVAGSGRSLRVEGESCPLSAIVQDHPQTCLAVESMLTTLIDVPVREACVHDAGVPPRCRFAVGRPSR